MKKINKLYCFILTLFLTSCSLHGNGQTQNINTVDTINQNLDMTTNSPTSYETPDYIYKRIDLNNHLSVEMNRAYDNDHYIWTTDLRNDKTNKRTTLYKDSIRDNRKGTLAETLPENPYDIYLLSGAYIDDKDLYVIYDKFGVITIYQYHFTSPDTFTEKSVVIASKFVTPAMARYFSNSHFKKINNDVYISVDSKQAYSSERTVELLKLYPDLKLRKITFPSNPRIISAFRVAQSDIRWMKRKENQVERYGYVLTKKEEQKTAKIKAYMDKEFILCDMSVDRDKRDEQISKLKGDGFKIYEFTENGFRLDLDNRAIIERYIKDVLSFCNQDSDIELLDALYYPMGTYFFYQNQYKQTMIIRYENRDSRSIWYISDYDESNLN